MKTLILITMVVSNAGWASHFMTCDIEGKVSQISNLERLDGVVIFRKEIMGNPAPASDFDQTITFEITDITNVGGHSGCLKKGSVMTLNVPKNDIGTFQVGQILKLRYQNVGDFAASRIAWDLIK